MRRILSCLLILVILLGVVLAFSMVAGGEKNAAVGAVKTTELQTYPLNADSAYLEFASYPQDNIYNTLESENGLEGTIYRFSGTVKSIESLDVGDLPVECAKVVTDGGIVLVINVYQALYKELVTQYGEELAKLMLLGNADDYLLPDVGETANFLTVYCGYSKEEEMPAFYLGASARFLSLLGYDDPVAKAAEEVSYEASIGEKNALDSARICLKYSAYSYTGLIEQLEYEGYTYDEAVYAADNCGADWNEQAAKSAEAYLKHLSFSRTKLIEQLQYEGFTYEQAVYGANANGY